MNSLLLTDGYKVGHKFQYPEGTSLVYSTWTPRKSRNPNITKVVHFGLQRFIIKWLIDHLNENFFSLPYKEAVGSYKEFMDEYLGKDSVDVEHIGRLHKLGYLPLQIKSLPEGTQVPMRVAAVTIVNTDPDFYWLTNYIETLMSCELWGPSTSATTAFEYKKILTKWAKKTGADLNFIPFQAHDFSMRGMFGVEAAILSGIGHITSFVGTDTIPAILEVTRYYPNSAPSLIGCSVPATEHAVMCAGGKEDEIDTFRRLITKVYPEGIVSVVSDTWDLWKVLTEYLPELKQEILARNGKLVIRPDSGDPVDIICGDAWRVQGFTEGVLNKVGENGVVLNYTDNKYYKVKLNSNHEVYGEETTDVTPTNKGVIELLWDTFGGTINEQGFKVLDPHIGAIYGDSITLERCDQICEKLAAKGFASSNIVFGVGSFTYTYTTRDQYGFAMKATYCEVNGTGFDIFKDPKTDDGTKKSAKGRVMVYEENGELYMKDQCTEEEENSGLLETVFLNGQLVKMQRFSDIRERLTL